MSDCTLTPQARAFSSILSAFIGSVVNGLTSGWMVAFITGWITFFASLRVLIGGSYMLYRSVTATWTPELGSDEYEMLNRASSPNPEAAVVPYSSNTKPSHDGQENADLLQPTSMNPPVLSELAIVSIEAEESYHRQVYISMFGEDGSSVIQYPNESRFGTFWPTRADTMARFQNAQLAQRKRAELRKFYASESDLERALAAFPRMSKEGKIPGPAPVLVFWEPPNRDITILGWMGWAYSALYSPISQIIWVAANGSAANSSGPAKMVKAISIGITALPLCIDTRVRFADSLRRKQYGGVWAYYAFNISNGFSCGFQGVVCITLLVWGLVDYYNATDEFFKSSFPWPLVVIYPIFSIIWAWASFKFVPMMDGGRKRAAQHHWTGYFFDVGMGAFSGLFVAAPAFGLYMSSAEPFEGNTGASDLGEFLRCEVPSWQKFSAIFP